MINILQMHQIKIPLSPKCESKISNTNLYDVEFEDESHMKCKRCGEDDEVELMVATVNGEPRYLCQKCGEMN
jgi:transposase-like protein